MIRLARKEDTTRIGELWLAMVEHHQEFDPLMFRASATGAELYSQRVMQRLEDPQTHIIVAEVEEDIVAYSLGMIADITTEMFQPLRCGLLADIYVSSHFRRRGLGRQLVERMMIWFRSQGVRQFEWHVSAGNTVAMEFWHAIGGKTTLHRMRAEIAGDDV